MIVVERVNCGQSCPICYAQKVVLNSGCLKCEGGLLKRGHVVERHVVERLSVVRRLLPAGQQQASSTDSPGASPGLRIQLPRVREPIAMRSPVALLISSTDEDRIQLPVLGCMQTRLQRQHVFSQTFKGSYTQRKHSKSFSIGYTNPGS